MKIIWVRDFPTKGQHTILMLQTFEKKKEQKNIFWKKCFKAEKLLEFQLVEFWQQEIKLFGRWMQKLGRLYKIMNFTPELKDRQLNKFWKGLYDDEDFNQK